jgi:hypothetical protein
MMTENQWPSASAPGTLDQYGNAAPALPPTGQDGSASKKQAAKEEASNVAGQAASAAQGVAQTAKEEVANVASEAKSSAQDLLSQAKSGLSSQAGTQQQKAAEGIRTISSQLQSMADAPDQPGIASDLIRQAADRTSSIASWVENKDAASLLNEVQTFARNKPGTFLLLAAGAGILAGRLTRGLTAGAPAAETAAIPPQPAQPPLAAAPLVTAGIDEPFPGEAVVPATYGDTIYGEPGQPVFSDTEAGGVPLADVDEPYNDFQTREGRQL